MARLIRAMTPLLKTIVYVMGGLSGLAVLGGIGAIIWNAYSPTQMNIFGVTLTTGHVGVAFTALGLICMVFVVKKVLGAVTEITEHSEESPPGSHRGGGGPDSQASA